jgi:hypothetical protein
MLEQKLQEELNRYKAINRYGKTMIMEQEVPPVDPAAPPAPDAPVDPAAAPMDAPVDPSAAPAEPAADAPVAGAPDALPESDTQELDITDLVDMTKSIKKDLENHTQDNTAVINKMDDVFTKLNDLEIKLAQMDQVMAKIDELGAKVQQMKPETPVEKLEMRSLDSYPFNEKPQEFFNHKQQEMQQSGKNEYVLTKDDVTNYDSGIKKSFNPQQEEDEYSF